MKKCFTFLAVINIAAGSTMMVTSCGIAQGIQLNADDAVLLIGRDIDKSKAIDDSEKNLLFSNYYILGDSLSDSHGIEKLVKNKFNFEIKIGTDDLRKNENYQYGSFTNGKTAAVLLNNRLGFHNIKPGIPHDEGSFGRNYAVAGATAADVNGTGGILLNAVTIEKQAEALVSQHKIRETDLVLLEIGGNDLFQIIGTVNDPEAELAMMQQSIDRIKTALFTLLNNGVRKILFSDAPNVSLIPSYNSQDKDLKQRANDISTEFHNRVTKMIKLANRYYQHSVRTWGLYQHLSELMAEFKAKHQQGNVTVNFNNLNLDFMKIVENKGLNAERNPNLPPNANINDYFFFDIVHPTKEVHQLAMEHYYQIVKEWS